MTSRRTVPSVVVLALVVGLVLAAAPVSAQFFGQSAGFGKNKVQYKNLKWEIYHSPHFDIYYYTEDPDLLQKVVSFAESAYDQLSQAFNYQIQKPTSLIFYETHADFEQNNVIQNFIPEGTGAFASQVRHRMFLPVDMPDHELMGLIVHELTHIFEYHMLFGGALGRGVAAGIPLWFMEGLAEYMRGEENARDMMFVRDAVVNDRVPKVTEGDVGGFFAYRFGYAVFDFIEEQWGEEGVQDFINEMRNTLGGRVGKAVNRAFQMSPEDFDADFRRFLRRKYLAELLETGEPADFGRLFRADPNKATYEISPAASPSGDLVAAFSTVKNEIDVVLFDTRTRTLVSNLTKGYSAKYQYFVAQELTMGRKMGRDIAFSADGNYVAFFARRNEGRHLVIVDTLKKKVRQSIPMEVDQQMAPAFHPNGNIVAFSGYLDGQFDIFEVDLSTEEVTHVTNDEIFDGAPVYHPDGQSMVLTSVVGGYAKLFQIDLADPSLRLPIREGVRSQTNEMDAAFSPDGRRLYFTSDASGAQNIYSFSFDTGEVYQHTNAVTGAFMPTVLTGPNGKDRVVFTGYWKGRFDLYRLDVDDPITESTLVSEDQIAEARSVRAEELPRFEPSIEVTIDDANKDKYKGRRFYLDNVIGGTIGVSDDQTFIAQIGFLFSDFLGDRQIFAAFQSISSFSNFDVIYSNSKRRMNWYAHLYDNRDFFVGQSIETGRVERIDNLLTRTGASFNIRYPFGVHQRAEAGIGYVVRDIGFTTYLTDPDGNLVLDESGLPFPIVTPRQDDYPEISGALVGDSAVFQRWGPSAGRRWRFFGAYAPNISPEDGEDSTLTAVYGLDFRQYFKLTQRSLFAVRLWGAFTEGEAPNPLYIGGLDTIRGFDFRSLVGDQAFYGNFELRFPIVDLLLFPILAIQDIRMNIFLDVGGVWLEDAGAFQFYNSEEGRLEDGVSSYGFGVSFRFFGMDLNWDFSKRWDFDTTLDNSFQTSFWIGRRF